MQVEDIYAIQKQQMVLRDWIYQSYVRIRNAEAAYMAALSPSIQKRFLLLASQKYFNYNNNTYKWEEYIQNSAAWGRVHFAASDIQLTDGYSREKLIPFVEEIDPVEKDEDEFDNHDDYISYKNDVFHNGKPFEPGAKYDVVINFHRYLGYESEYESVEVRFPFAITESDDALNAYVAERGDAVVSELEARSEAARVAAETAKKNKEQADYETWKALNEKFANGGPTKTPE